MELNYEVFDIGDAGAPEDQFELNYEVFYIGDAGAPADQLELNYQLLESYAISWRIIGDAGHTNPTEGPAHDLAPPGPPVPPVRTFSQVRGEWFVEWI